MGAVGKGSAGSGDETGAVFKIAAAVISTITGMGLGGPIEHPAAVMDSSVNARRRVTPLRTGWFRDFLIDEGYPVLPSKS